MSVETPIDAYVREVASLLQNLSRHDREETLRELESLLLADAERLGDEAAIARLGDAAGYAARMREALTPQPEGPTPQGTVLGMPYDFRGATIPRVSERLWNPTDPRVFVPRLFGVGWTINFGALAVRLHLLRPDDAPEAVFERIPASAVWAALAVPMICAIVEIVLVGLAWGGLPAQVPVHWGVNGAPDDWTSRTVAFGMLMLFTVIPVCVAFVRVLRSGCTKRARVVAAAATGVLGVIGVGITAMTVADANGGASGNIMWVVLVVSAIVGFLLLYVPVRLGMAAEWHDASVGTRRRDRKGRR